MKPGKREPSERKSSKKVRIEKMSDQVYSMGSNENKETGHLREKKVLVPTLVPILEGFEIVQVASGNEITLFLTSEGGVLEI